MDPISVGIEVLPLVGEQLKAFRARDEVSSLFRLLREDLRATDRLPFGVADRAWPKVNGLRLDPTVLGALQVLLERGDLQAVPHLRKRLDELLVFPDPDIDDAVVAQVAVDSFANRLNQAKRDDRSASHLDFKLLSQAVDASNREIIERLDALPRGGIGTGATDFSGASSSHGLGHAAERAIGNLEADSEAEAHALRAALQTDGVDRLDELLQQPQPWIVEASAALLATVGLVAQASGHFTTAEQYFRRAAGHPGIGDRVRQLLRAAAAAESRGASTTAQALIDDARAIDPNSPALRLFDAQHERDAAGALELLARVTPVDDLQRIAIALTRCSLQLRLNDVGEARKAVEEARGVDPADDGVAELDAVCLLAEVAASPSEATRAQRDALRVASTLFEGLATEMENQGRPALRGLELARACCASALAGERDHAEEVFTAAFAEVGSWDDPGVDDVLCDAAMLLGRFSEVMQLSPADGSDETSLRRASAIVYGEDRELMPVAVTDLDRLVNSDQTGIAVRAAIARLSAAAGDQSIPWSERAAVLVGDHDALPHALLRAERLFAEDDPQGARTVLMPFSSEPQALRTLIDFAVREQNEHQALRLSTELLERSPQASDRLRHAVLLARSGERERARDQLVALARDDEEPSDARRQAFDRAVTLSEDIGDLTGAARLAEEWADRFLDQNAKWRYVYLRARRTEFDSAYRYLAEHDLHAPNEGVANLAATVIAHGNAAPLEKLVALTELSDRFARPETLEYQLIVAVLRVDSADRPQDLTELHARIAETFQTFTQRFPDSRYLRAFALDPADPVESFRALLEETQRARADVLAKAEEDVRQGRGATSVIAAAVGRGAAEVWSMLPFLPLGYSDETLASAELADATAAVDQGSAVWDPSSIAMAVAIGGPVGVALRGGMPASVVAQATLDDAVRVLAGPADSGTQASVDETSGELVLTELPANAVEAIQSHAAERLALARDLTVRPDRDPDRADVLDEFLASDVPTASKTWAATLVAARRFGLAVYSDDRYVRLTARQLGLRAFGTLALMSVLRERGGLSAEDVDRTRRALALRGAWGLELSRVELLDLARDAHFQPTPGLMAAFTDLAAWRSRRIGLIDELFGLIEGIFRESPGQLGRWVHRMIDAANMSAGPKLDYTTWGRMMLSLALNPFTDPERLRSCLNTCVGWWGGADVAADPGGSSWWWRDRLRPVAGSDLHCGSVAFVRGVR